MVHVSALTLIITNSRNVVDDHSKTVFRQCRETTITCSTTYTHVNVQVKLNNKAIYHERISRLPYQSILG